MLTTALVIAALLVGGAAGFALGRRSPKTGAAAPRTTPRRVETPRSAGRPVGSRGLADDLLDPDTRTDLPVVAEYVAVGNAIFPGAYTGDVYVTVACTEPTTDVTIEVVWGAYTGTVTLDTLGIDPIAVGFTKDDAGQEDAVVTIKTSHPTHRLVGLGTPADLPVRRDLTWK